MRSAIAAEWILSLVTAPDRAAATVGDLMEEGSAHGVGWFWSNVLRTASGHVWRGVSASPLRALWHAIWGLLAIFCLGALCITMVSMWVRVPTRFGSAPAPWGIR